MKKKHTQKIKNYKKRGGTHSQNITSVIKRTRQKPPPLTIIIENTKGINNEPEKNIEQYKNKLNFIKDEDKNIIIEELDVKIETENIEDVENIINNYLLFIDREIIRNIKSIKQIKKSNDIKNSTTEIIYIFEINDKKYKLDIINNNKANNKHIHSNIIGRHCLRDNQSIEDFKNKFNLLTTILKSNKDIIPEIYKLNKEYYSAIVYTPTNKCFALIYFSEYYENYVSLHKFILTLKKYITNINEDIKAKISYINNELLILHNDFHAGNILVNPENHKELKFIDWEFISPNENIKQNNKNIKRNNKNTQQVPNSTDYAVYKLKQINN